MSIDPVHPDLEISLRLEPHAPRAARHLVAQVDRPSPDLRDAVVLLTSELVARAVQQCGSESDEVSLHVWMPWDVVRVELRTSRALLPLPFDASGQNYDVMLGRPLVDRHRERSRLHVV
jgi:hypothetical protein